MLLPLPQTAPGEKEKETETEGPLMLPASGCLAGAGRSTSGAGLFPMPPGSTLCVMGGSLSLLTRPRPVYRGPPPPPLPSCRADQSHRNGSFTLPEGALVAPFLT